ncbi:hypothetical protein SAMN04515647_1136 [Cohaesibacter sp. ES.047]|uniref:DUF2059 domain-containing protein n=1 Tax=Cohaesibacter sp. ES.047 TaxID=1798205 RepID=UPI000BB9651E|nr:DUF2059 domain-containing protein [Cohaesibacter sp. ES.047]SNY90945.1 hypothetical protein SAMN04515647_1136 [Cohaesibacter sp. ES.047]
MLIRRYPVFVTILLVFIGTAPCHAKSAQEKEELARMWARQLYNAMDAQATIDEAMKPFGKMLRLRFPKMTEEQEKKMLRGISGVLAKELQKAYSELEDDIVNTFTYEELVALDEFYGSPIGESIAKKTTELRQKIDIKTMHAMKNAVPKLIASAIRNGFRKLLQRGKQ